MSKLLSYSTVDTNIVTPFSHKMLIFNYAYSKKKEKNNNAYLQIHTQNEVDSYTSLKGVGWTYLAFQ
jgi:hypothetical protein